MRKSLCERYLAASNNKQLFLIYVQEKSRNLLEEYRVAYSLDGRLEN